MIHFTCYACHFGFDAQHFNLARVTIACPVCQTENDIAQRVTRTYGKVVGEQVTKIMEGIQRVADRSRNALMTTVLDSAYQRIVTLCEEAS